MPRRRSDPLARQAVLGIAAGRIAIGARAMFATGPALGRSAGGRDIALGLLALAARDDRKALRAAALAGAAVDAADAVSFGIAARDPLARPAGIGGGVSGRAPAIP